MVPLLQAYPNGGKFAVSPDDTRLAADDGRIWDLKTGMEKAKLDEWEPFTSLLAFSPNGKLLAGYVQGKVSEIRVWNLLTGKVLFRTKHALAMGTLGKQITFSHDNTRIALTNFKYVLICDLRSGKTITLQEKGNEIIYDGVVFSPTEPVLLLATFTNSSKQSTLELREADGKKTIKKAELAVRPTLLSISSDGSTVALRSGGTLAVWDLKGWSLRTNFDLPPDAKSHTPSDTLKISGDNNFVAAIVGAGTSQLADLTTQGLLALPERSQDCSFISDDVLAVSVAGSPLKFFQTPGLKEASFADVQ